MGRPSAPLCAERFASRIREISRGGGLVGQARSLRRPRRPPASELCQRPAVVSGAREVPARTAGALAESLPRDASDASKELETWTLATYRACNLVSRGLFGILVRVFPRVFGAPGGTCTNRPNRGGTAAALTIGPAATSLFRRASTCRFRPSRARAPSSWRSPASAKTTSSTVSDLSTISTA